MSNRAVVRRCSSSDAQSHKLDTAPIVRSLSKDSNKLWHTRVQGKLFKRMPARLREMCVEVGRDVGSGEQRADHENDIIVDTSHANGNEVHYDEVQTIAFRNDEAENDNSINDNDEVNVSAEETDNDNDDGYDNQIQEVTYAMHGEDDGNENSNENEDHEQATFSDNEIEILSENEIEYQQYHQDEESDLHSSESSRNSESDYGSAENEHLVDEHSDMENDYGEQEYIENVHYDDYHLYDDNVNHQYAEHMPEEEDYVLIAGPMGDENVYHENDVFYANIQELGEGNENLNYSEHAVNNAIEPYAYLENGVEQYHYNENENYVHEAYNGEGNIGYSELEHLLSANEIVYYNDTEAERESVDTDDSANDDEASLDAAD